MICQKLVGHLSLVRAVEVKERSHSVPVLRDGRKKRRGEGPC
jgi:hypothetical protein